MDRQLTSKQKEVLVAIRDYAHKNGISPTLEAIRKLLNYTSLSSVQRHTDELKRKGYLVDSRGISLIKDSEKVQIPLVGQISAGTPLLAIENVEAYVPYDSSKLQGDADDYFFLRATGDSMNKSNINDKTIDDGDCVLVKKQPTADFGSRVVALIGDDATVKKMVEGEGCIKLMPESDNDKNKPFYMFDDFTVQGIAVDVLKGGGD